MEGLPRPTEEEATSCDGVEQELVQVFETLLRAHKEQVQVLDGLSSFAARVLPPPSASSPKTEVATPAVTASPQCVAESLKAHFSSLLESLREKDTAIRQLQLQTEEDRLYLTKRTEDGAGLEVALLKVVHIFKLQYSILRIPPSPPSVL